MQTIGVRNENAEYAANLVLSTKHIKLPVSHDAQITADIDLLRLGKPFDQFAQFNEAIRREYLVSYSKEEYNKGRIDFLQQMLARDCIFYTKRFRDKYEEQARKNIKEALLRLKIES